MFQKLFGCVKFVWLKLNWLKKKVLKSIINNLLDQIKDFNLKKKVVEYITQNEEKIIEKAEDAVGKVVKETINKVIKESENKA